MVSGGETNDNFGKPPNPVAVAILDDDPSIRNAISRFLRTWDLKVNAYGTCVEFMRAIAERRPDCLLLDLHMPDFDGIAVMKHLNYTNVRIPIIIISAEEETKFRDLCHSLGAIRYLRKPLNGAELLNAIEDAVAHGCNGTG